VTRKKTDNPGAIRLQVNGKWHEFRERSTAPLAAGRDITPNMTLAFLLREKLGLTGLKLGCDQGACGACTVLMDGKAVLSCMVLAVQANGHHILTIEGLPKDDPVVESFAEQSSPGYGTALQCGICTPGFVMTVKGFLNENPDPTFEEIKEALSGNICRCGCYAGIAQATIRAAEKMNARKLQGGVR
jgi:carbon-monoxide dehydrogenase small subunit